jgi:hypothetical protein
MKFEEKKSESQVEYFLLLMLSNSYIGMLLFQKYFLSKI